MEAIKNLSKRHVRIPCIIIIVNFILVMLSGPFAIIFYAIDIFKEAGVDANEHLAAIITAVVRIAGGVLGIYLVQKLSRKTHAMVTISLMALSMIVLGIILYLKQTSSIDSPALDILPIICVSLYLFSFGAGVGPLQWVFLGELLPPEYKVLSGLIVSVASGTIFVVTKIFPALLDLLASYGTYWLFASFSLSANILYFFFLPETKGKTLLEIQQIFSKKE